MRRAQAGVVAPKSKGLTPLLHVGQGIPNASTLQRRQAVAAQDILGRFLVAPAICVLGLPVLSPALQNLQCGC